MPDIDLTELHGADELELLSTEWGELCDRARGSTPFQRPEWLIPWMRHFSPARPLIWALRASGRLIGLAPLFVYREGQESVCALLGAGVSDYGDILVDTDHEPACLSVLADALARLRPDRCRFDALAEGAVLARAAAPAGWTERRVPTEPCPRVALSAVPSRQLARWRKYRNRVQRIGTMSLELATPETRAELLAALFRLHGARWQSRGQAGVLADIGIERFHDEASARMCARGALRLYALTVDGRVAAVLYAFREKRTLYCYLQGFDPELEKLSPGVVILGEIVQSARAEGIDTLDFLRGREAYKYAWGAEDRPALRRELTPPRLR